MTEDKQTQILEELKRRAQEIRFGSMTIELRIHEGKISGGEIIHKKVKLG